MTKDPNFIDEIIQKIGDVIPPPLKEIEADLLKKFHSILQGCFAQLNLVTREEFDIQAKVLQRTREKLEALEKQVAEIEKQLFENPE
ncbi:MAG: accessory factor UbiK family protein [Proteobacteria bacterium]|nr:accessory factor UbiK family protein [Pseudomonadota bacterium]